MCDDDVAALVVDNGSGMCKAGFAGDDAPSNYCLVIYYQNIKSFNAHHINCFIKLIRSRLSLNCWSPTSPRCDGRYGSKGLVCR
jgi:actin-related protein